jgi:Ca2+-binding EF-hand superfamily protein
VSSPYFTHLLFFANEYLANARLVDFETFSKILNRPGGFREPFDIEEYIRGFQVFDKDRSGFVGKGQIKYILTNLGEKMSEEEVDELFKSTIDASNNEVDYRGEFTCSCVRWVEANM